MKTRLAILVLRIRVACAGVWFVVRKPASLAGVIIGAFVSSSFILWSLNLDLVRYIVFDAPISFLDKIRFFSETYRDIFTTYDSLQALGIIVFSLLFGLNIVLLAYVWKHQGLKNIPKKSGIGGMLMAVLAGGCVACGTSLLAPLLATFGATSSAFLRDLSVWLSWGGSVLIIFSIYKLGQIAASLRVAQEKH